MLIAVVAASLVVMLAFRSMLMEVARELVGSEAVNATNTLALPLWLDNLTQETVIAYPSHVALATAFEILDLSPAATGVQWLKAAAHAPSEAALERTARGMAAAVERDSVDKRAFRTLCNLKELGDPGQIRAVEQAGIPCEQWTPNVALSATVTPAQAVAGSVVTVAASVVSRTDVLGLVDIEIHNADGERISQWVFLDQELIAEQRHDYQATWDVPPALPPGTYTVKLGVFERNWRSLHGWKRTSAIIEITR